MNLRVEKIFDDVFTLHFCAVNIPASGLRIPEKEVLLTGSSINSILNRVRMPSQS
jgi:hypothetical protein